MRTYIPSTFIYICLSSLVVLTMFSTHVDVVNCGNHVTIIATCNSGQGAWFATYNIYVCSTSKGAKYS